MLRDNKTLMCAINFTLGDFKTDLINCPHFSARRIIFICFCSFIKMQMGQLIFTQRATGASNSWDDFNGHLRENSLLDTSMR